MLTISQLKQLCSKYRLTPSKNYGQNFLINPAPIEKMLEAAGLSKSDIVIEVGPGFGALTFALAERAGKVIAFEIEKKLQPYWDEQLKKHKNIEVRWGNVLKAPITNDQYPKYKVIANLPYQITSNVLRKFLEAETKPESMLLMVQKEVAERICAQPGDMSLLAVSVQYFAEPEIIMKVPRGYFWPEPKVDSAVVRLLVKKTSVVIPTPPRGINFVEESLEDGRLRDSSLRSPAATSARNDSDEWFFKTVKAGFAQKRKLLIKNLQPLVGKNNKQKLAEIFVKLGLSPNVRAQELSVRQWQELSKGILHPPRADSG